MVESTSESWRWNLTEFDFRQYFGILFKVLKAIEILEWNQWNN